MSQPEEIKPGERNKSQAVWVGGIPPFENRERRGTRVQKLIASENIEYKELTKAA
jgi:hypothetical protein